MSTNRIHAGLASLLFVAAACGGAPGDETAGENAEFAQPPVVSVGTELRVQLGEELSTSESRTGDTFQAAVVSPIERDGVVLIPAGSRVTGRVTAVQEAEGEDRPAVIKIEFSEIEVHGESYPLAASVVEAHPETRSTTSTGEDVAKVGAGTAAGAIVGRIIGGNATGTLVGAAVGAAAGTAIVLGTQDVEAVLPQGSIVTLRLDDSLRVEPADAG